MASTKHAARSIRLSMTDADFDALKSILDFADRDIEEQRQLASNDEEAREVAANRRAWRKAKRVVDRMVYPLAKAKPLKR